MQSGSGVVKPSIILHAELGLGHTSEGIYLGGANQPLNKHIASPSGSTQTAICGLAGIQVFCLNTAYKRYVIAVKDG